MNKFTTTLTSALLLFSAVSAKAQSFTTSYGNGSLEHAHYDVQSINGDMIMSGTVFETGNFANSDIHMQRVDGSGAIIWDKFYDLGDKEEALALTLKNEDVAVVTGSVEVAGDLRIFILAVDQNTGMTMDYRIINPPNTEEYMDQIGNDLIYSEAADAYYLTAYSQKSGAASFYNDGFLISLDASFNVVWSREIDNYTGCLTEIDGVGIYVGAHNSFGIDYGGNIIWQTPLGGHYADAQIDAEYDPSTDRLFVLSENFMIELLNASTSGTFNQAVSYYDNSDSHRAIQHVDLEYNEATNELLLLMIGEEWRETYRNYEPIIVNIDAGSLAINNAWVLDVNGPSSYYHGNNAHYVKWARLATWDEDFGYVCLETPSYASGATNDFNIKLTRTLTNGQTELECETEIPMLSEFIDNVELSEVGITPVTCLDQVFDSFMPDFELHFTEEGCFNFEPCGVTINSFTDSYADCYQYDFEANINLAPGTVVTSYVWNWGDGTSTTTTNTVTNHQFSSASCIYNVCVTVNAIGSDGSTCSDTYCRDQFMLVFEPCQGCGEGARATSAPGNSANASEFDFAVSPNPSATIFNVELKGEELNGQFEIKNTLGQTVYTSALIQGNYYRGTIDASSFEQGVYLIVFTNGEQQLTKRIIKL